MPRKKRVRPRKAGLTPWELSDLVRSSGIRKTAKRLGWHPQKVQRFCNAITSPAWQKYSRSYDLPAVEKLFGVTVTLAQPGSAKSGDSD